VETLYADGSGGAGLQSAAKQPAGCKIAEKTESRIGTYEMRPPTLLLYVGALLMPLSAAAQNSTFAVDSEVHVRADSFACKETAELDRLLQRNQSGGFTSGEQMFEYLKTHNCIGLTEGFARVMRNQGQYVCIYDPKDKNSTINPCAWTRTEMLSKK